VLQEQKCRRYPGEDPTQVLTADDLFDIDADLNLLLVLPQDYEQLRVSQFIESLKLYTVCLEQLSCFLKIKLKFTITYNRISI